MKKTLILLLGFSLFVACNNNKNNGMKDANNNRQTDDYRNNSGNKDDNGNRSNSDFNTGGGSWSSSDIRSFNAECLKQLNGNEEVANKFCPCFLEKMENKYSSFNEMNQKSTEEEGEVAASQCKKEIGMDDNGNTGNNDNGNNNGGGSWTREQESQWTAACETPALIEKMGQENGHTYCDCMLRKLEQQFPNYNEVDEKGTYDLGVKIGKICLREMGIQ